MLHEYELLVHPYYELYYYTMYLLFSYTYRLCVFSKSLLFDGILMRILSLTADHYAGKTVGQCWQKSHRYENDRPFNLKLEFSNSFVKASIGTGLPSQRLSSSAIATLSAAGLLDGLKKTHLTPKKNPKNGLF